MNANGDSAPQNLNRAYAVMRGEVRKLERARRKGRIVMPPGTRTERLPRALCPVCTKVFDFAQLPPDTLPKHRLCSTCKGHLADGYTIFVHPGEIPLMAKSAHLTADGMEGKIAPVSKEDYDKLAAKLTPTPPTNGSSN